MSLAKEILGRGWSFPFGFNHAKGGVSLSQYEENIRQSITVILSTRPGERQMLPEFGCRLHELLFAPNNRVTSALVAHHVTEALERWEPRISVEGVSASPETTGSIKVSVDYRVAATKSPQNEPRGPNDNF